MTAWLRRKGFPEVSKHTVDRLMRDEGMNGLVRGRRTRTTIPGKNGKRAGDLLNRNFTASAPNRVWVTDFTYVPVYTGFVYVALVIDLYSRAIVDQGNLPEYAGSADAHFDAVRPMNHTYVIPAGYIQKNGYPTIKQVGPDGDQRNGWAIK